MTLYRSGMTQIVSKQTKKSKKGKKHRKELAKKYNKRTGGGSTFQPMEES